MTRCQICLERPASQCQVGKLEKPVRAMRGRPSSAYCAIQDLRPRIANIMTATQDQENVSAHNPEPIPGAFHESAWLVVLRGTDMSNVCFCCGQPSAGKPITKRLRPAIGSASGRLPATIRFIEMAFQVLMSIFYRIDNALHKEKRKLTFGLCPTHRRRRMFMNFLRWIVTPVGVFMFFMGVEMETKAIKSGLANAMCIVGAVLIVLGYMIPLIFTPGPTLEKESPQRMWLRGAALSLRSAQPAIPTKPAK